MEQEDSIDEPPAESISEEEKKIEIDDEDGDESTHGSVEGGEEEEQVESSDDDDDDDDDNEADSSANNQSDDGDGISDYERLRLERIKRNQARLLELGLVDPTAKKKKKIIRRKSTSTKNQQTLEPTRQQSKRQVKADAHQTSASALSTAIKRGMWRCGECQGCQTVEDCQTCVFCAERREATTKHTRRCLFKQCWRRNKKNNSNAAASGEDTVSEGNLEKEEEDKKEKSEEDKKEEPVIEKRITRRQEQQQQQADQEGTEPNSDSDGSVSEETDPLSQSCDICKEPNHLIRCHKCKQGYHSNCHVPKIKFLPLPTEEWLCMDCHPRSGKFLGKGRLWAILAAPSTAKSNAEIVNIENTSQLVKVKILDPLPFCLTCHTACSSVPGDLPSTQCKACDKYYHLSCHNPPLEGKPKGRAAWTWKCTTCKDANRDILEHHKREPPKPQEAVPRKKKPKQSTKKFKLFQGEHDDDCFICDNGGELVCCDFCEKVFHMACHIPPLPTLPADDSYWKCCECSASEQKEMRRCGDCPACWADDCGTCKHCLDMPKFGGNGTLNKECVRRDCPNKSYAETYVPGKVPGEITRDEIMGTPDTKRKKRKLEETVPKERVITQSDDSDDDFANEDAPVIVKLLVPKLMDSVSFQARKIIKHARRNMEDSKIQDKACELLRKLATSPDSVGKLVLLGCIEFINEIMTRHVDKSIVQAEACAAIAEMAWVEPIMAVKIAHVGLVQRIIHCMDVFPVHSKVQQMGCGAFRALSYDGSKIVVINNTYGLAPALKAIKRNPRKLAVQKEACFFIRNMIVQIPETVVEKTLDAQVLGILLASLVDERGDADLRECILRALANLVINDDAKECLVKEHSVIPIFLTSLQDATNGSAVKQSALSALQCVAANNHANKLKLAESGGITAATFLIRSFPQDPKMLESSFAFIKELLLPTGDNYEREQAADVAAGEFLADQNDGKTMLLTVMERHLDYGAVQVAACGVIAYLPYDHRHTDTKDQLLAEAILKTLNHHSDAVVVQFAGVEALLELATHVPLVCNHLIQKKVEVERLLAEAKSVAVNSREDADDILALLSSAADATVKSNTPA